MSGILTIIVDLLRLIGFCRWADSLWQKHQAKVKAKEQANVPLTNKEELDRIDDLPSR